MARRPSGGSSEHFLREYESIAKDVKDGVREYLGDPNEDNAHELRGSLRRLDAALRVLPKRARREARSMEDYDNRARKLLRLTSPIRDVDMLARRLTPQSSDPSVASITRKVKSQRQKHVANSMKAAWKLFETKPPKLDSRMILGLDAHARKVIADLDDKLAKDLTKVLASESRVGELHSLRKRCKRLRYMIELLPPTPGREQRAKLLRSWQDSLGAIRDSDVLIARLGRKDSSPVARQMIQEERLKRHARYLTFVRNCRRRPVAGEPKQVTVR
jgi:CHAD domain-containing protein